MCVCVGGGGGGRYVWWGRLHVMCQRKKNIGLQKKVLIKIHYIVTVLGCHG